ncbi:hypothetical protein ACVWXU_000666 [Streptomyces sp. TE33382]
MAPAYFADIHGRNGKRSQLLWLDSAHADVAREVAALRAAWEQHRLTPWTRCVPAPSAPWARACPGGRSPLSLWCRRRLSQPVVLHTGRRP